MDIERTKELAALLRQTREAHDETFDGGDDPDWAIWYADRLHDRLLPFLAAPIPRSRIVHCLVAIADEHAAAAADEPRDTFFASRILECLGAAEQPSEDRLALYHFDGCPYCRIVRREIDALGIEVELRNIFEDATHLQELMEARGRRTVPVLRIYGADGEERWMPESADIVRYLRATYGSDG